MPDKVISPVAEDDKRILFIEAERHFLEEEINHCPICYAWMTDSSMTCEPCPNCCQMYFRLGLLSMVRFQLLNPKGEYNAANPAESTVIDETE